MSEHVEQATAAPGEKRTLREYAALIIQPGDRVLIEVDANLDQQQAMIIVDELHNRFPDVEFTVLGQARVGAVYRRD